MGSFAEYHNKRNKTKINLDNNIIDINIENEKEEESPFMKYHNEREKQEYEKKLRKKEYDDEEDTDTWFKKGAFDDGYQFGDLTKTVGSTVGDAAVGLGKGIFRLGEGVGDLISYGVADIQEWTGNEEAAEATRERTRQSVTDEIFQPAEDFVDKNSVLGDKSDSITEGLGYVAGITAISIVSGGAGSALGVSSSAAATVGSTAATFTSAMGSGMSEALNDGATIEEARIYGAISGAGEAASELLFGGLGKASGALGLSKGIGELDDIVATGLTKKIKNKLVKTAIQSGVKASAEGLEEIVSGLISSAGKKLTYMNDKEWSEIVKDENLAEQFWMGALTSAIAQRPSVIKSVKSGTDYITGRTSNEQQVYDSLRESKTTEVKTQKAIDNMVNEQQTKLKELYGRELTTEEVNKIKEAVNETNETGRLNIEDTKLSVKEKAKIEEEIENDLAEGNLSLETIRDILGENVDLSKDNLLQRSLYENSQKYEDYKVELTENEKVDKFLQSAAEAGVNNTTKTRKRIELISKLVENTDRNYRFVNQEQLKENGYNENANGLNDNGEILLNVNSNKEIVAVVGHETTHLFDSKVDGEYTQEYKDLQDAVKNYLQANGTYEAKINEIMDTYNKAGINLSQEQIMEEVTADTIGDNLFGDNAEEFIKHLTTNRTVFQKIYDYIKKAVVNIKGYKSEEAKQLQNLKNAFDRVYKTLDTTGVSTDTKYSIQQNDQGQKYVKVDTDQDIFNGIDKKDYNKIAKMYIQDYLMGKTQLSDNDMAVIDRKGANKYTNPGKKQQYFDKKMKLTPELKNALEIAQIDKKTLPSKDNSKYKSWEYYKFNFELSNKLFEGTINIGIDSNGNKHFYEINKIKEINDISETSLNRSNISSNNSIPSTNEDVNTTTKYSIQNFENNTQDNQGRNLSKGMQKWAKDSQARTDNGELVTVYHTTTDNVSQFNEFNPVGTPYYRFGDQVVNYYTDSKDMSGSYANNRYEMADTKRLNNLEEARQWLKSQNSILDNYTIEEAKDKKGNTFYALNSNDRPIIGLYFENKNDLLRNLKQKFNEYRDHFGYNKSKLQYEGYVNITNPYIIDAEGKNWDSVISKLDKEIENEIKELKKNTKTVTDLINLQIKSKEKHNQYLNQGIEDYSGKERYNLTEQLVKDLGRAQPQEFKSILEDTFWFGFDYDKYKNEFQKDGLELPDGNIKINEMLQNYYKKHDGNDIKRNIEKSNLYGEMTLNEFLKHAHKLFEQELLYGKEGSYFEHNYSDILGKKYNSQTAISPNQLYRLAKGAFSKEAVLDILGERQTTNDIVKQVIEMNKNGANYDGIIMKNVLDYGGNSKTREPANLYVTFASNQFKAYDNTNPTSDPDIRYSMTEGETDQYWKKQIKNSEKSSFNLDEEVGNYLGNNDVKESKTVEEVLNETPEEKQQSMKDKAKKYISRSRTNFINNIVDNFGTSKLANTNTLNTVTEQIREDVQQNGKLTTEQKNKYFNDLYNNLVKIDTQYYDTYKEVKDNIRNTKLYINDNIRGDIADFGDFRRSNMGTIIMTNDSSNISVDQYYQEMSDMYPELFPKNITNPTDQLQKISEVAKDIKKVETNVAAYNDATLGKDYRNWARETFDKDIDKFVYDIKMAERYNNETNTTEKFGMTKDLVKQAYNQLPAARRKYEKASAKEVLTKEDRVQVDRLLNNEITIQEIPDGLNKEGIVRLATAKAEYDAIQKSIKEYQLEIKQNRIEQAKADIGNLDLWKDKKIGFQYSRETPIRNIYDVAPKGVADTILNKYFRPYIETNEKKVINETNEYFDRVRDLDLSDKKKYKVTIDGETKKVSESALVQLLGENKITLEQIKNTKADSVKIESAVNEFRNIYNEMFEKINESMLDNGYAPVEYRKDYFPHFTEQTTDTLLGKAAKLLGFDLNNREELPTDISGQTYQFKPGRTWFSNLLQRTTDVTDYDAKKGFEKYVKGAMDLIYHTGDIQNLRALSNAIRGTYNDTEIKNQVQEINESTTLTDLEKAQEIQRIYDTAKDKSHLSKFTEWLDNYINLLAGKKAINDRGAEKELNRTMYQTMTNIESRIAANAIGGNVGVSLTNFAPISQAWGEVKTHNLINGMWQTMKSSIKGDDSFVSESQFITRRRGIDNLTQTKLEKATAPINALLEFADRFTSETIVRARYNQNIHQGMNTEHALEEADRYTAGLMADRGRGALPTQFSNKNPIAKMINMFQVEVNNQWSYYIKDLPRNIQEKANNNKAKLVIDTAMAYTKIMVGSYLINELLGSIRGNSTRVLPDPIYIVKELIKGLSDGDDDNDDDAIIGAMTEVAGNLPFISLPATLLTDSLGLDIGDIGRIPISGSIPNIADITKDLLDSDMTAGEKVKSIGGELADTVGASLILPYGGSQIKKTVKGLSMYTNDIPGSYTDKGDLRYTVDEDVGSKVQAALFGAYANPYAQDYIDSGFKTIKKDNIDEMVGLDMNSTEYRQFKSDLSKVSDTSDKNGYNQYIDENNNVYWYDANSETMYDSNYKKTTLTEDDLIKVSKKEQALNYINSLDLTTAQKNLAANNLNKNSKKKIDMSEYGNYDSYEEYQYARDYPKKYSVVSQIAEYDDYVRYKDAIAEIKKEYSTELGYESKERKAAVQSYIEGLDLNMYQKMMLEKMAGGYSIKKYQNYIYEYLETTGLSESEKYTIWEELFE